MARHWARDGKLYRGTLGDAECFAVAAGMGAAAATRGVETLFDVAPTLDVLMSVGWAGALVENMRAPFAVSVGEVVESRTGERYSRETSRLFNSVEALDAPTLVTVDRIIPREAKQALGARYGASLVDMEAATVARLAYARGVRFLCVKAISDNVDAKLPDFNHFISTGGTLRMPSFLTHVILRPGCWPALVLLGINSKRAAEALAAEVPACLRSAGLIS